VRAPRGVPCDEWILAGLLADAECNKRGKPPCTVEGTCWLCSIAALWSVDIEAGFREIDWDIGNRAEWSAGGAFLSALEGP
jgi:hypothetical protein